MKKLIFILLALIVLVFSACSNTTSTGQSSTSTSTPTSTLMGWTTPPPLTIDQNKQYTATIKTNYGDIIVQLFAQDAPLTVNNFVFLSQQGFYNHVPFYRIIPGFEMLSGEPLGELGEGPGYTFGGEIVDKPYSTGTLAMSNMGTGTNGSGFFICLADLSTRVPLFRPKALIFSVLLPAGWM